MMPQFKSMLSTSPFLAFFSLAALSLSAAACSATPPESSGSSRQAVTGPSGPASNVDPAFAACALDSDCVAVAQAGCCHNGWRAAVSSDAADDYAAANQCQQQPRPICALYIVNDTRVPECGDDSLCAMVGIVDIDCSIHDCPDGYTCDLGDTSGTCVPTSADSSDDAGTDNATTSSVKPYL